jgi:hypothetical protein
MAAMILVNANVHMPLIDTDKAALDSIPVVPRMNFDTANATATVTIPVYEGVVPGPCLARLQVKSFIN